MTALELWTELAGFLRTDTRVVHQVGQTINVGELFTVRVTVRNAAPPQTATSPLVRFLGPYLYLYRTDYAQPVLPDGTPVDGIGHEADMGGPLDPGQSLSEEFRLLALKAFSMPTPAEQIANVWTTASVDLAAFFKLCTFTVAKAQIYPGLHVSPAPLPFAGERREPWSAAR